MAGLTTVTAPINLTETVIEARQSTDVSFVLEQRTDDPSTPEDGQMWYRTDLD